MNLLTVQELLGHKTLTMTLRYAHLALEHRTEAVRKLEARTGSRKGESITILLRSKEKGVSPSG